ncbi:hypothetical protein CEXT_181081 [Caerostris extrusa]|uniref:Uncharacterized protein n=1 Tax=Caerostris extrusa TaxID=172846 RepID=A0AAV4NNA9_CAEEX|nr:hypothetical protein CEXT_181081 [Caerostris extrusa]
MTMPSRIVSGISDIKRSQFLWKRRSHTFCRIFGQSILKDVGFREILNGSDKLDKVTPMVHQDSGNEFTLKRANVGKNTFPVDEILRRCQH